MDFRKHFLVFLMVLPLIFPAASSFGQFSFNRLNTIPVTEQGRTLQYPWAGGLNCAQFSQVDLNNDSLPDLYVFNRSDFSYGGYAMAYRAEKDSAGQIRYIYDDTLLTFFPPDLEYWVKLMDFNKDGVADILTSFIPGSIGYYRGFYNRFNQIEFEWMGILEEPLRSGTGFTNIFVSPADIPAFYDVNGDGDVDVLTFNQFGFLLDYFENLSIENGLAPADTLIFSYESGCFCQFLEIDTSNVVIPLDSCDGFIFSGNPNDGAGSGFQRHAGSTIDVMDEGNDGALELLMGDISFRNINRLRCGAIDSNSLASFIGQDPTFPSYDTPVEFNIFPAAFVVDVNQDGLPDFIASPNQNRISVNTENVWLYLNTGNSGQFQFELQTKDFLTGDMMHFGEASNPVFFDYDQDGLMDLVIGNFGYHIDANNYQSRLALYRNVGTAIAPAYELVTKDYCDLSLLRIKAIYPSFGDLDGDGIPEMVIGDEEGYINVFKNNAPSGQPLNYVMQFPRYRNIDAGQNAAPFIYDVNGDGLLDFLIGNRRGLIEYYENQGTLTMPVFSAIPTNPKFGDVTTSVPGFFAGYASPLITTLDTTPTLYLLSGSEEGLIKGYIFDRDSIYPDITTFYDSITQQTITNFRFRAFQQVFQNFSQINEGERVNLTVADLNADGKLEMVTGNMRGGVSFYTQSDSIQKPDTIDVVEVIQPLKIRLFPNPGSDVLKIQGDERFSPPIQLSVYHITGRMVYTTEWNTPELELQTQTWAKGMYFVRWQSPVFGSGTLKWLKQ